jgi:UDP-N-acetylmuramate--alanine ligase
MPMIVSACSTITVIIRRRFARRCGLLRISGPKRLVVAFQPHRFTRTLHLMQEFAASFDDADKLFLTEVYAASEAEIAGANSAALADVIRRRGKRVEYVCGV